jgi:hypothetical protein
MGELKEGIGSLQSRWEHREQFEVSWSITFRTYVQAMPTNPRILTKPAHIVNHIRSVDGREIPDGEYKLTYTAEDTNEEVQYLTRSQGEWEVLIKQSHSW